MNRNGTVLLIIAIIFAIVSIWINSNWLSHKDFQFIKKDKKIDFYLSDFTLLNTQANGEMRYLITGKHLIHQVSNKATVLFSPLIKARGENGDITLIKAKKAEQKIDNGPISLLGDIFVEKNSLNSEGTTRFKTKDLVYNPNEKTLSTDSEVTFISDFGHFQGTGLTSKLNEQEIRIHSNVQSTFLP